MKYVFWQDNDNRKHRSLLRDHDPESSAPGGIPADPPDVRALDWAALPTELHNALVDRGLYTWDDVQKAGGQALTGAILSVFRVKLTMLYQEKPHEQQ